MSLKAEVCPNCQRQTDLVNKFCPFCGGNFLEISIVLSKVASKTGTQVRTEKNDPDTSVKPRNTSRRFPVLLVPAALMGVLFIAALSGPSLVEPALTPTATPSRTATSTAEPEPMLTPVSFADSADTEEVREVAISYCGVLEEAIVKPDFLPRPLFDIDRDADGVSTNEDAQGFVQENLSWVRKPLVGEFQRSLTLLMQDSVPDLLERLDYDSDEYDVNSAEWVLGVKDKALELCDLEGEISQTEKSILDFQAKLDRILGLAN